MKTGNRILGEASLSDRLLGIDLGLNNDVLQVGKWRSTNIQGTTLEAVRAS